MDERNKREPFLIFLDRCYEGDPLSPPEGEASQGERPLDPLRYFFSYKGDFQITFLKGPCIF